MLPVFFVIFMASIGQTSGGKRRKRPIEGSYRTNGSEKPKKVSDRGFLSDKQEQEIEERVQ